MKRHLLFAACAVGALSITTGAYAQTQAPEPPQSSTPTDPRSDTEGQVERRDLPQPETGPVGDIVVTAQGRAQALADVPVAISAVTQETLALSGANDIRQLNQVAPSLLVSSTGSEANASPRIRGIGTVGDNPGLESSVVVFIDGVYRSRSGIGMNELGEIDRVEVLRGPQGTLGGRNSSAGLISIVSVKPSFNLGGNGEFTYGNYNNIRVAGGLTGPLTETIAARVDAVYVKRDGFYYDPANDRDVNNRDRFFGRAQLLFEPTKDITFRLIGDYTKRDEQCCGAIYVDSSVNPAIGLLNNPATPLVAGLPQGNNIVNVLRDLGVSPGALNQGYSRVLSVSKGRTYLGHTRDWGVSGQLDWDFGGVKLTSITAYRDYRNDQAGDVDYSAVDLIYNADDGNNRRRFKTFTQEVRFNGTLFDNHLDWLIGGFYANEKFRGRNNLRFGSQYGRFANCRIVSGGGLAAFYSPTNTGCVTPTGLATIAALTNTRISQGLTLLDSLNEKGSTVDLYNQNSDSFAVFTHNIVHLTSTLDVTLGLRYTNEKKRFFSTFGNDNTVCSRW